MHSGLDQTFFERHINTSGQQEKVINITNDQGNANQNHNDISPHTCQNFYCKKEKDNKYGEKGILVHYSGNINWYIPCGKQ